jgi:F-type H+-transporting ATPase subunit b
MMKKNKPCSSSKSVLATLTFLLLTMPAMAMAASPEWRPTYDKVMLWVNFAIFMTIAVKYGREPIKNFLKQQKEDVVTELDTLETEKARVLKEIQDAKTQAAESEVRFKELKERLISQGETKKQQIVEHARQQSSVMIEETRKKMETRLLQAKNQLKMELADMAFEKALQTLPQIITESDNQRLLDIYMESMHLKVS